MRILHLTDLHVGMASQEWLWPTAKKALLEDLARLHDKVGGFDLVVFSGDLTQKADSTEYIKLNDVLGELWDLFNSHGSTPHLFPIPGNHDLARPKPMDPTALMMKQWWESLDVRRAFWQNDPQDYRTLIDKAFAAYTNWLNGFAEGPIPLVQLSHGILPGDAVAEMKIDDLSLGIVGLNTAWLQLDDGDHKSKLDVDPRQLMALTNGDPDAWCAKHDFNLLITHHPQEWLHPRSLDTWRSEVHTPSRFDAHLFGHMHEASIVSSSEGGALDRRYIQGASMFGLEKRSGNIERVHGYSVLQLSRLDGGQRQLRQWPRRAHKGRSAIWKLIPDPDFDCDDSGTIEYSYGSGSGSVPPRSVPSSDSATATLSPASGRASLIALRKSLFAASAFADVRGVEKELGRKALATKRVLWLVSDWGLGDEQFIRTLQSSQPVEQSFVFKLDCQNFFKRDDIYSGVQDQIGCSFEQMCEQISLEGPCILVLDDVPIQEGQDKPDHRLQSDIEFIVKIMLQYCADLRLIVKSRRSPENCTFSVVELRPFDEADTLAYVAVHEHGGRNLATTQFISQLFRHTDGIPTRIDRALRDVQIVGVTQLHTLDSDVAGKSAAVLPAPSGLIETLKELEQSEDPTTIRAFKLLKVLTMFPRGEQLGTVKRFYGTSQFYAQDARILLDAALADAVEVPCIGAESNESAKALVVRRPIREYLYTSLSAHELKSLNRQSLELYFGKDWALKGIKSPKHMRFNDPRCGAWQIGNASMLILRATREAAEGKVASRWLTSCELASAYCTNLTSGNHFLAVVSLCEDLLPLLEGIDSPPDLSILRTEFAKALRMTRKFERAIQLCEQVQATSQNKKLLQSTHLTLAMCYEGLERTNEASQSANACSQLDLRSNLALQARAIDIGLKTNDSDRITKLRRLEAQARKKKAFVVANNIAMRLAHECTDPAAKMQQVSAISEQAVMDGDHHNAIRSIIQLAKMHLNGFGIVAVPMLARLIDAYHYLYGEDLQSLFRTCHAALWRVFEGQHEIENLLRLFRYSSLKWRVRGLDATETEYIERLSRMLGDRAHGDFGRTNRELAYFLARTSHAIRSANE